MNAQNGTDSRAPRSATLRRSASSSSGVSTCAFTSVPAEVAGTDVAQLEAVLHVGDVLAGRVGRHGEPLYARSAARAVEPVASPGGITPHG